MARDLFAEIGAGRDLFAELNTPKPTGLGVGSAIQMGIDAGDQVTKEAAKPQPKPKPGFNLGVNQVVQAGIDVAKQPGVKAPAPVTGNAFQTQTLAEIKAVDAELAAFDAKVKAGEFGGGRGATAAYELRNEILEKRKDLKAALNAGQRVKASSGDIAREVVNAPFRGVVNTVLGGTAGALDLVGLDGAADSVRDYRDETTEQYKPSDALIEQNRSLRLTGQLGEGAGSTLPYLVAGIPGRTATAVAGVLAAGGGVDQQDARVDQARLDGKVISNDREVTAEILGAGVGLLELAPVSALLSKVPKGYGARAIQMISERMAARGVGRVTGAAFEEGVQEAISGVLQDLVELGVYNEDVQVGQSALEDFALGAAVGGTIRGGVEGVNAIRNRPVAAGKREQATATVDVKQTDVDSPYDTETIVEGRTAVADAMAMQEADKILKTAGMPATGRRVAVTMPDGTVKVGVVDDAFDEDVEGERATGINIRFEDGSAMREHFDTLADAGVSVAEVGPRTAADIDADLAARAAQGAGVIASDPIVAPAAVAAPQQPQARKGKGVPVDNAKAITEQLFPGVRVTSWARGQDDPLTKKNPGSWHAKSRAAVDVAPIEGMTFDQFVQRYKDAGYTILEVINETGKGKTAHATGDHWHIVLGEGGGTDAQSATPSATSDQTDPASDIFGAETDAPMRGINEGAPDPTQITAPPTEGRADENANPEYTPDRQDILAVVDANNQVRNARSPSAEREAFRQGAAFQLQLTKPNDETTAAAAADYNEQFRAGMESAKKEFRARGKRASETPKNGDTVSPTNGDDASPLNAPQVAATDPAPTPGQAIPQNEFFTGNQPRVQGTGQKPTRRGGGFGTFLEYVTDIGGVRDDEGNNLAGMRGLQQGIAGAGSLIRKNGLSIDQIGERAFEDGWFNERPTTTQVLELLDKAQFQKIYNPLEDADRRQEDGARAQDELTDKLQSIAADFGGIPLNEAELRYAVSKIASGEVSESAVLSAIEWSATQDRPAILAENGDNNYAIPFDGEALNDEQIREVDRVLSQGSQRPAPQGRDPRTGEEAQQAPAGDSQPQSGGDSQPQISDTPSGKGILVSGASETQLAAIKAALPENAGIAVGKSGVTYSKKHEDKIRGALNAVSSNRETPTGQDDGGDFGSPQPTLTEEAPVAQVTPREGEAFEPSLAGLPRADVFNLLREQGTDVLDLRKNPTGWKRIEWQNGDGAILVNPTKDEARLFKGRGWPQYSGAYAIDNAIDEAPKPDFAGAVNRDLSNEQVDAVAAIFDNAEKRQTPNAATTRPEGERAANPSFPGTISDMPGNRTVKEYIGQGFSAAESGWSIDDNPYYASSTASDAWRKGFRSSSKIAGKSAPQPAAQPKPALAAPAGVEVRDARKTTEQERMTSGKAFTAIADRGAIGERGFGDTVAEAERDAVRRLESKNKPAPAAASEYVRPEVPTAEDREAAAQRGVDAYRAGEFRSGPSSIKESPGTRGDYWIGYDREAQNPAMPAAAPSDGRIGTNDEGNPLYEDESGVRSFVRNGIRLTESVGMVPTRDRGMVLSVDASARNGEYLTEAERENKATPTAAQPEPAAPTDSRFAKNKIFTEDKIAAAKARMKDRMNRLNSGVDPEMFTDGMLIAGGYIEAGIRNFAEFAKAMQADFGKGINPYLLSFWEGARNYPGLNNEGMTSPDVSRAISEMITADMAPAATETVTGVIEPSLPAVTPNTSVVPNDFVSLRIGNSTFPFTTMREMSELYLKTIANFGIGVSQTPQAIILDANGEKSGEISYNGKVWRRRGEFQPGDVELYDPSSVKAIPAPRAATNADDTGTLINVFVDAFTSGRSFASITEARSLAAEALGRKVEAGTKEAKMLDEAIEAAVIQTARRIAARDENNPAQAYNSLVSLYSQQPKLTVRTSTSIEQQAYSTPAPLAYLASRLAGISQQTRVYEPSAGNGALLIDARATYVTANELNPDRAAMLRRMFVGATVTEGDAITDNLQPKQFDVVIANPPFGPVKDDAGNGMTFDLGGGYVTREIDHAISMKALDKMTDDGRAVLIIGGINKLITDPKARADAYNGKAKREFFFKLFSQYNVVDHFTVDGSLYERQGAGWPVDLIVINGRGKSALSLPAVRAPRQYNSWQDLAEVLSNGRPQEVTGAIRATDGDFVAARSRAEAADGADTGSSGIRADSGRNRSDTNEQPRSVRNGPVDGESESTGMGDAGAQSAPVSDQRQRRADRNDGGKLEGENARQVSYTPGSSANAMGTLVPVNMQASIDDALDALRNRVGDIDAYVGKKLGYGNNALFNAFGAEQIDAIALAIDNIENGAGFIIGDQTGIGKGRVVAAVIRYAIREGRPPIFVTEKPALYKDMFRDMEDIGMVDMLGREINAVMTNSGEKIPLDEDETRFLKSATPAKQEALLQKLAAEGLQANNVDVVMTTYAQMQTVKGQETSRMAVLRSLASQGGVLILDESHNAGGTAAGMIQKKAGEAPNRAEFVRELVNKSHGVFYSSATYAKRPDVMDLYAATDMRLAVKDPKDLGEAIAKGGVPMQQVVAAMLARAGQYVRRERSFDGIAYNTPTVEVDMDLYAASADVLASIQDFSELYVGPATEEMSERLKEQAESVSFDGAVGSAGASSTNFTSVMHNVIDQMLLAFSADAAADRAIAAIKNGEKPVITVANTLEAMLKEFADDAGINIGEVIDITFANVFKRYLERTRYISVKKPFAEKGSKAERVYLTDADLGPDGVAAFRNAMDLITDSGLEALPGSPVDYIISRIEEAGYSIGEITGRTLALSYRNGKTYLKSRPSTEKSVAGKIKAIAGFNNGKIDAMLLNRSGSTGLSLHASKTFKDQRKRRMIIAQAEGNIDTHMQMLGRVHRTGQVVLPEYDQIVIGVPAAKRPAAVLAKKMASLNANTTASRDSALTSSDTIDFMNVYGDEVVANLMMEEPDIHYRLAEPLKGKEEGEGYNKEDAARKVTGRIPLLPVAQQEDLYQRIEEEYLAFLEQKNAAGENALEAKTFELDAITESSSEVVAPNLEGKDSPFGEAVRVEVVDVKRLGKPYPSSEVAQKAADAAGVQVSGSPSETQRNILSVNRPKHVADTREWMEKGKAWHSEDLAKIKDDKARTRAVEKFGDNITTFRDIRGLVGIGESVKLITENGNYYGVVTDLRRTGNTKNPLAPGSWKATFAVVDGARSLTFPFSQLMVGRGDTGGKVRLESADNLGQWPIIEAFDKMQSTSREKRTVVTGNMLAGFNYVNGRGSIINYTTDTGDVRQGIMMPKDFDLAKHEAKQPIPLASPEVVLAWLAEVREPLSGDGRTGNKISIFSNPYRNEFTVVAAKSKAKGGEYFLNRGLTDALQTDFVSRSNGMVANTNIINAEAAIEALLSMGVTFEVPGNASQPVKDKAKALVERIEGAKIKRSVVDDVPVAKLTGEEMGKMPQNPALRIKILRDRAINWYRSNLQGTTVRGADGVEVRFSRSGMKKSTTAKGRDLLRAVPAIRAIIENGTIVQMPDRDVTRAFFYSAMVELDGVVQKMGVVAVEDADGRRQYDLTKDTGKRSIGSTPNGAGAFESVPGKEASSDADFNLFIVDEQSNTDKPLDADKQEALADLQARMQQLGIQEKIALRVVDRLGARTAGQFDTRWTMDDEKFIRGTITIALDSPQARDFTLNHEAIHAMRSLGLFRDAEWAALSRRAQADPQLMRSIKRRYSGLSEEAQIEEAIADMFAGWKRLRNQKGLASKAFDRILAFITAVSAWAKGRGYTSAEDVMRAIDSGKQAGRGTGQAARGGRADSLFDEPEQPKKTMTDKQRAELDARQKQGMARKGGQQGLGDQEGGLFASERDQGRLFSRVEDIRSALGSAATGANPFSGKVVEAMDRWRTGFQDRYLPLLRTQQAVEQQLGRTLKPGENPYLREELMSGRIGAQLEQLSDGMIDPLFEAMHAEDVTVEQLETYLYARHAEERNARIAEINPAFEEGTGSGMTDLEAIAILNRIERSGELEKLQRVARMVDNIRDFSIETRIKSGLMSQEDADAWRATYEHYVPLRGREEIEGDETGMTERVRRSGGGINVKGKESKRAFGRVSKADNILAYTLLQAEDAIVRAETNTVAKAFYQLAKNAPDPDFWEVEKVTRVPVMNEKTGLVRYENQKRVQPGDQDYTVTAKINGEERRVTMNRSNPEARRLADSMRNLTQMQTDVLVHYLGKVNRFLSAVNTSYNPEFVITNAFRDIQAATINAAGVEREGLVSGTLKDYRKALVASVRGSFKSGDGGEWSKWYDEFISEGGRVYFNQIDDLETLKKRVEQSAAAAAGGDRIKVKTLFLKTRDFVENANNGVENAVRLAAYKNARELGMSKVAAASLAKNLTVNFNRRGQFGPAMNAAYLFFNASVQGTARMFTAMKSKRVQKIMAGVAVAGFAIEMLNAMMSDDDDDGESFYDKISDFEKSRNLIIMLPGNDNGRHIKLPLPYGYNAFYGVGRTLAEIGRRGGDRAGQSMGNLATTIVDAFNPVGGTESLLNFISPTILDPVVDLERNRDFTDRPIMPEQNPYQPETPDAQRYYGSVGTHWRAITDALTSATGGDDVVAGAIDVSPETLEHLAGVVMGATGAFIDRNVDLGAKIVTGDEEITASDIPLVRKLVGNKPSWYDKSAYYDRVGQVEKVVSDAKDYAEREDWEKFDSYVDENMKLATLEPAMKAAQKEMRKIRKAKAANEFAKEMGKVDDATYRSEKQIFNDAEKLVVTQFNSEWNATMSIEGDDTE